MSDLTEIIDRQKKEIVEFINGVARESYQQGRADAIDTYEKRLIEHIATCKKLYNSAKRAGNKQGMLIHDSKIAALEWELERLKNE